VVSFALFFSFVLFCFCRTLLFALLLNCKPWQKLRACQLARLVFSLFVDFALFVLFCG
jgi:hypothetical protein